MGSDEDLVPVQVALKQESTGSLKSLQESPKSGAESLKPRLLDGAAEESWMHPGSDTGGSDGDTHNSPGSPDNGRNGGRQAWKRHRQA